MATVNDIGVPGQPATNLTAWQAAVRDRFKGGAARIIYLAQHTADHNGFTGTAAQMTGMAATVTVPAGHLIRVTLRSQWLQNTAAGIIHQSIREGASILQQDQASAAAGGYLTLTTTAVLAPTAGAHTYIGWAWTTAGTADAKGQPYAPKQLTVEDLGLATPIPY